jgi:MFS family permease
MDAPVTAETAADSGTPQHGGPLRRNRNFTIFLAGQTFSVLGDTFAILALPLLVLQATGSVAQMGLVTATFSVGQLVAGVFSGALVDRVNRRRLMLLCDVLRALLYGAIPLCWAIAGPQIWLIYVVTALVSGLSNCFQVAYITAITNLVDHDQITEANGRLQTTFAIAFVLGPALAGVVSARFGPATAIGFDAATFALSAVSLALIRFRQVAAVRSEPGMVSGDARRRDELLAGVRFLLRQPVLRMLTVLLCIFFMLVAAGNDLFIYHLKHDLGQDDNAVGILFGLASVGAIGAGVLLPTLRRRLGFGPCWIGGTALSGLALVVAGFAPGLLVLAVAAMGFTFADTLAGVTSMSLRQQITPNHLLGRVTAAFFTLNSALAPIGAALMTALAARIGATGGLALMGIGGLALALIGIFSPVRARWPERTYALPTSEDQSSAS